MPSLSLLSLTPLRYLLITKVAASLCIASDSVSHFLGPDTCALCHKEIAAAQSRTAMANTWQGATASWLPPSFHAEVADDLAYAFKRVGPTLNYSVDLAPGRTFSLPISIFVGGRRHGLGFLVPVREVEGIPLARPALVQARYAWSPEKNKLLLAPGCPATKPASIESALGLVLSPAFELRCLSCHGQPGSSGSGDKGGVHCEACHGPGSSHLLAIAKGTPRQGILNPKHLSLEDSMAVCARCHVGLTKFSDPSPRDLLVANQVRAIQSSECFVQSRKGFSCTTCHDPHGEPSPDTKHTVAACLNCHSSKVISHTAICPVNQETGCPGCHMPAVDVGPLHLVDHVIRVHPESTVVQPPQTRRDASLRSRIQPVSEFLRLISTNSSEAATTVLTRLMAGDSFYTVARESSVDHSAAIGGYLGSKNLTELDPNLRKALAQLNYGETTAILRSAGKWVILQRLPRDFRTSAEQLQDEAEALAARGDAGAAVKKAQEALKIYPHLLRALNFVGATFTQTGNPKKGVEVLTLVTHLYPNDAGAEFALAASLSLLGDQAGATVAFKRVIALEEDFTAAYINLGMLSYANKDWQTAISIFRRGLRIDPMSAELSYDLGLALNHTGDTPAGITAINLARKLDPDLVARREIGQ